MAKTKIGKVKILLKGEYNSDTQYIRLDGVTYNGSFYICKQDCQGINVDNQEYWQLAAEKGDKPINGVDYNTEEEKAEFKKEIISEGKTQLDEYNVTKKAELDAKEVELEGALTNKKDELIIDIDDTLNGFEDNVEQKIADFNTNASEKTASFNQNAQTQTSAFDSNAETQTEKFNTNATSKTNGFDTNATEKTTSFDTNATEKTTTFDTNATSKTNEYNSNATQLTTQTDDLFDALTTNEASGTEIYIDDAKACRVISSEIDGMYQQETTNGTNLMNLNVVQNSKVTVNEDGTITINGTGGFNLAFESFTFKANIPYYIKWEIVTGTVIETNNSIFRTPDNLAWAQKDKFTSFSVAEDKTLGNVWIHKDANFENAKIRIWISESQSDFEPYTGGIPSPNPDYPQAIEQVESIKLNVFNKNLLNLGTQLNGYAHETEKYFQKDSKAVGFYFKTEQLPDTIYVSSKNGNRTGISYYDKIPYSTLPFLKRDFSNSKDRTITIDKNYKYIHIQFSLNIEQVDEIQIEKGTTKTDYKLSQVKAINIDLKGNKLCAVSDTIKDKLLIDKSGNVALQKNVLKFVLNGNQDWVLSTAYTNDTYLCVYLKYLVSNINSNVAMINDSLPQYSYAEVDNIECINKSNRLNMRIKKERLVTPDVVGLKEYLKEHNITIYASAETPVLIDLGQLTELPKTFNGINNIWAETNLGNTQIEIEYVQDVKKLIENLQALALDNATTE